ncbi:MAG: hypothetical protein AAF245_00185, partial [Pseudomonadota bacterium]
MEDETEGADETGGGLLGENTGETIVEQEVGAVADFVTEWIFLITGWVQANILTLTSVWQIAALAGTLTLGLLVRRSFKRFLDQLSSERALGPILQRLLRTVAAISLPVCWVIGLWIAGGVFQAFGLPI